MEWAEFLEAVPSFLRPEQAIQVSPSRSAGLWAPASSLFSELFPSLAEYLKRAVVTPVAVDGAQFLLFSRRRRDGGLCAWLSPLPSPSPAPSVHQDHQVLLASFGGISEHSNAPDNTWLLNHDSVLTESEAQYDGTFVQDYAWAFDEAGLRIPVELPNFYSIAREANGNTTLCHRVTGEVLLFAPDHAFQHVTPYAGCPEYTLYCINDAATFREWVNAVADQWLADVE